MLVIGPMFFVCPECQSPSKASTSEERYPIETLGSLTNRGRCKLRSAPCPDKTVWKSVFLALTVYVKTGITTNVKIRTNTTMIVARNSRHRNASRKRYMSKT